MRMPASCRPLRIEDISQNGPVQKKFIFARVSTQSISCILLQYCAPFSGGVRAALAPVANTQG